MKPDDLCESVLSFYFTRNVIAAVLQGINLSHGTVEELQRTQKVNEKILRIPEDKLKIQSFESCLGLAYQA